MVPDGPDRKLYSGGNKCPYGCVYCFADMAAYRAGPALPRLTSVQDDQDVIIYPSCDSELVLDRSLLDKIHSLLTSSKSNIYISFSTKSPLKNRVLYQISSIDELLRKLSRGFVKAGVSFSGRMAVSDLEPRTPSYHRRLESLKEINQCGVICSVNIKPILPQVNINEYKALINETFEMTDSYLIGGLYIDPATTFGAEIVSVYPHLVRLRRVDWLPNRPYWSYVADEEQIEQIRNEIASVGVPAFNSDLNLMRHFNSLAGKDLLLRGHKLAAGEK